MKSLFGEQEYKATTSQWVEFLRSSIWNDLQLFIADRIEVNRDMLELTDEERRVAVNSRDSVFENADIIRGRNREAKMILFAPEEILKELQENEENSND